MTLDPAFRTSNWLLAAGADGKVATAFEHLYGSSH